MSENTKEFFTKQTNKKLRQMKEDNLWIKFKDKLVSSALKTDKMSYRPSQLNIPDEGEAQFVKSFDPEKTKFSKDLQRSQYLFIEENVDKLAQLEQDEYHNHKDDECPVHGGPDA